MSDVVQQTTDKTYASFFVEWQEISITFAAPTTTSLSRYVQFSRQECAAWKIDVQHNTPFAGIRPDRNFSYQVAYHTARVVADSCYIARFYH